MKAVTMIERSNEEPILAAGAAARKVTLTVTLHR